MADPTAQTFYATDDVVLSFADVNGSMEQITFTGGSVTTSDPGHLAALERAVEDGTVSASKPPKPPTTKDA